MSDNLHIYNLVKTVPPEAQKPISGGRLSGKTDINPMWRIKTLTEQFGPCGVGWKYVVTRKWTEKGANDEVAAFVDIDLFYVDKETGHWSEPIPGTGGSAFVAKEKNGLYTSDECFKMALTDAISVACKALGFAADIYWNNDPTRTKYDVDKSKGKKQAENTDDEDPAILQRKAKIDALINFAKRKGYTEGSICKQYGLKNVYDIKSEDADSCMIGLSKLPDKAPGEKPYHLDDVEGTPFGGDSK